MKPWEEQKNWNVLQEADHVARAAPILKQCCKYLGLQEDVELLAVKDKDRFLLSYAQDPTKPDFGKAMIKLETMMRTVMGVVVDLRLEAKTDLNRMGNRSKDKKVGRDIK